MATSINGPPCSGVVPPREHRAVRDRRPCREQLWRVAELAAQFRARAGTSLQPRPRPASRRHEHSAQPDSQRDLALVTIVRNGECFE
jgi:hypothetical protein